MLLERHINQHIWVKHWLSPTIFLYIEQRTIFRWHFWNGLAAVKSRHMCLHPGLHLSASEHDQHLSMVVGNIHAVTKHSPRSFLVFNFCSSPFPSFGESLRLLVCTFLAHKRINSRILQYFCILIEIWWLVSRMTGCCFHHLRKGACLFCNSPILDFGGKKE